MRRTSVFATVVAIAAVALTLGAASSAKAERVIKCSGTGQCVTVCRQQLANGNTVDYSEGTTITVNYPDGTSRSYTCKDGNWVPTRTTILGTILAPSPVVFAAPINVTTVTCPVGVMICAVPVAARTP